MKREYNKMCLSCEHLNKSCGGTTNTVWSGCIIKDQSEETAAHYIETMTKLIKGEAQK